MTKTTYFNASDGSPLAEEKDSEWIWLLRDPKGSVATRLFGSEVRSQQAYDPYGAADIRGTSFKNGDESETSSLGFQGSLTDEDTDNLILGPRMYDPKIDRFTTADYFVGSGSDMQLGTDALTGNRYLFAGANPVAFYEDGWGPCDRASYAYCSGGTAKRSSPSTTTMSEASEGESAANDARDYWRAAAQYDPHNGGIARDVAAFHSAAATVALARDPGVAPSQHSFEELVDLYEGMILFEQMENYTGGDQLMDGLSVAGYGLAAVSTGATVVRLAGGRLAPWMSRGVTRAGYGGMAISAVQTSVECSSGADSACLRATAATSVSSVGVFLSNMPLASPTARAIGEAGSFTGTTAPLLDD